jgi:hypothetical protein
LHPTFLSGARIRRRKAVTVRAYIWLACHATDLARFDGAEDGDAVGGDRLGRTDELAVPAALRRESTMTEPGFMPRTMSVVTRSGAFAPGTTAGATTDVALARGLAEELALTAVEALVEGAGVAVHAAPGRRDPRRRAWSGELRLTGMVL